MTSSGVGVAFTMSLLVALILQLVPLSAEFIYWRPDFLLLITVGWIIYSPDSRGIGFAASMGLLADLVFASPLGLHVLLFAMVGAIPLYFSGWLMYFTLIHRCGFIFCLIAFYQLINTFLFSLFSFPVNYGDVLPIAFVSALIWPIVDRLLFAAHYRH